MTRKFRTHGEFSCYCEGQVLITELTGPWNIELVEEWCEFVTPHTLALSARGPYVGVARIHRSMLCPPDAMERLSKIVHYATRHLHCICNVVVVGHDVEGRHFVEPTFVKIYGDTVPYKFFYELEEAKAWAHALLGEAAG
jgi:hypothetical protein